jgi:hypothetical protein
VTAQIPFLEQWKRQLAALLGNMIYFPAKPDSVGRMAVRLSYSLNREEYAAAAGALMKSVTVTDGHLSRMRKVRSITILYCIGVGFTFAFVLFLYPESARPILLIAGSALILDGLMRWGINRLTTETHGVTFHPRRHENMEAVFDQQTVTYAGREHKQEWRWSLLQRLHDLSDVLVLEFAGFEMLVVPKRAFETEGQHASFLETVARHLPNDMSFQT